MSDAADRATAPRDEEAIARAVRSVRLGHGANCSSVGSVIDTLFAAAVIGGAVFAAVAAALAREEARVLEPPRAADDEARAPRDEDAP